MPRTLAPCRFAGAVAECSQVLHEVLHRQLRASDEMGQEQRGGAEHPPRQRWLAELLDETARARAPLATPGNQRSAPGPVKRFDRTPLAATAIS